ISESLARVLPVAERIDHRNCGECRKLFQIYVPENTSYDAIHPERKIARKIRNTFAFAEAALAGAQQNRPGAELPDGNFKSDSCPQRWLLKDQRKILACEGKITMIGPLCSSGRK